MCSARRAESGTHNHQISMRTSSGFINRGKRRIFELAKSWAAGIRDPQRWLQDPQHASSEFPIAKTPLSVAAGVTRMISSDFSRMASRIQRVAVALGPVAKIRVAEDVALALTNTPSSKRQLPLLLWVDLARD
jgi:hypothetical protein